jgi:hypothetical protein
VEPITIGYKNFRSVVAFEGDDLQFSFVEEKNK